MAIDFKYGQVTTEWGGIGKDERVVVFRAQDKTLPLLLGFYHFLCSEAGSPRHHLDAITDAREKVIEWQEENSDRVGTPD